MMEGIPASRSVTVASAVAIFFPRKYSPVKSATGRENGIQISSASPVVSIVPVIKGSAPYFSFPAVVTQSSEQMKFQKPKCSKAPEASSVRE